MASGVILLVTNGMTLGGLNVFDKPLLESLSEAAGEPVSLAGLKARDAITLAVERAHGAARRRGSRSLRRSPPDGDRRHPPVGGLLPVLDRRQPERHLRHPRPVRLGAGNLRPRGQRHPCLPLVREGPGPRHGHRPCRHQPRQRHAAAAECRAHGRSGLALGLRLDQPPAAAADTRDPVRRPRTSGGPRCPAAGSRFPGRRPDHHQQPRAGDGPAHRQLLGARPDRHVHVLFDHRHPGAPEPLHARPRLLADGCGVQLHGALLPGPPGQDRQRLPGRPLRPQAGVRHDAVRS